MRSNKKHTPLSPEMEELTDRLDDRYVTQTVAIYYTGAALATVILPLIAWIILSIFSLKEQSALTKQAMDKNEAVVEEFMAYHKNQIDILKEIAHNTDINVTAMKTEMDDREHPNKSK